MAKKNTPKINNSYHIFIVASHDMKEIEEASKILDAAGMKFKAGYAVNLHPLMKNPSLDYFQGLGGELLMMIDEKLKK